MRRSRLTWNKKADNAPATPNEGYDHPADQGQQPVEKYFIDNDGNGVGSEPSDFAEDVHQPPYNKGDHPATPHEGHDHPAMKQAARDIRASVERKASKCIRIAQATLGKGASIEDLEDQALAFMNMADEDVVATLDRLSEMEAYQMAEEPTATAMFAEEDSELEGLMAEFMAEIESDEHEGEEEAMLAEMLAEEEKAMGGEEAMLSEMLAEEEMADQNAPEHFEAEEAMEDELMLAEEGLDAMGLDDGMGDDELLAGLFAGKFAGEEEAEEEEAEEEEKEAEEAEEEAASKKASRLRPRARKASKGVKTLGNVSKTASSEMNELSKLWESAPNISDLF